MGHNFGSSDTHTHLKIGKFPPPLVVNLKYKVGSCISYLIHDNVKVDDSKGIADIFNKVRSKTTHEPPGASRSHHKP